MSTDEAGAAVRHGVSAALATARRRIDRGTNPSRRLRFPRTYVSAFPVRPRRPDSSPERPLALFVTATPNPHGILTLASGHGRLLSDRFLNAPTRDLVS